MDTRTTAEAACDAAKASTALFAVKSCPRVDCEAVSAARILVMAMGEDDVVASEILVDKALECAVDAPEIRDLVERGAKAVRRFVFLAETGGR